MLAGVVCLVPDVLTAVVLAGVFIVLYCTTDPFRRGVPARTLRQGVGRVRAPAPRVSSRSSSAGCARRSFPAGTSSSGMKNRGWGVYLGIAVLLPLLWVYRVYLR
ncbi:MAG: hypothetical protein MZV65_19515 [Chromatiales bacterium]|nr:hypothetical protein [Chromatiales bacterium]